MARSRNRLGAVLVATLIVVPTVAAGKQPGPSDITGTSKGNELKAAAGARFADYGVEANALRVLSVGGGDYLVVPDSLLNIKTSAAKQPNGKVEVTTEVTVGGSIDESDDEGGAAITASAGDATAAEFVAALAAPYWTLKESGCFARILDNAGFFDTCYKIRKLINDGISGKVFYNLEHYGTAGSYTYQTIDWAKIWSDQASGSAAMSWSDWGPRSDLSQEQGRCTDYGVSIGIIVQLHIGLHACEKWDMTKYADAGHYQMHWSCNCIFGVDGEREVEYMTEVTIPSGGPLWVIGASFDG